MRPASLVALAAQSALLFTCGCGGDAGNAQESPSVTSGQASPYPATAKVAIHEQFLEDLALERHASDGGGRVELRLAEDEDGSVVAGGRGRWTFDYTAGELGIQEGGSLLFLVPPFWGWSTPQATREERSGFTTVVTDVPGLQLAAQTLDRNLMRIELRGRGLASGESIRITYGAGAALARADDYAEENSAFYFKVDGDGDGLSGLVNSRPAIRVLPGPPARLSATLPSTAEPGTQIPLNLALLDVVANRSPDAEGTFLITSEPPGLHVPGELPLSLSSRGTLLVPLETNEPGTFRIRVVFRSEDLELQTLSNPVRVLAGIQPVYWGDLHGHSNYSDGTGTPEAYYRYAREVAALDFAVLTDHDHFGVRFLDATPEIWTEIRDVVERANTRPNFVALLGYEWTSWLYGHRHVVSFGAELEVLSSVGASTTTPAELWAALRGKSVLTFAHHSAGGPVATDWSFPPDPVLEPVTEVMSVHGSSEAHDSPSRIYNGIAGNYVRDQLDLGARLGFVGSGDGHDGHPGFAHLAPSTGYRETRPDRRGQRAARRIGKGGLAAVLATDLSEPGLLAAFRKRATYATSGPRIWLEVDLADHPMGSVVELSTLPTDPELHVEFAATSGVEYVEIIRRGSPIERLVLDRQLEGGFHHRLPDLRPEDYVYVRLLQNDGALAWSSPIFLR